MLAPAQLTDSVAAFFQSPALLDADRAAATAWLTAHGRIDGLSAFASRCCRLLLPSTRAGAVLVPPITYANRARVGIMIVWVWKCET